MRTAINDQEEWLEVLEKSMVPLPIIMEIC